MPKHVEFIDDLRSADMTPERIDAISQEAAARLIERHGPGRIEARHHEGFEDGYNWVEVTLHQSAGFAILHELCRQEVRRENNLPTCVRPR